MLFILRCIMRHKAFLSVLFFALVLVSTTACIARTIKEDSNAKFGWKFEYDDKHRIIKSIDPAGKSIKIGYSFDHNEHLRKLVLTNKNGIEVIHEFDNQGKRMRMTDNAGSVSYAHDELDRLTRVRRRDLPAIIYTYDTLDRIKVLQLGDFYRIEYTYDFLGRLASMNTPAGTVSYNYLTGQGKLIRTLPNGVKTISEYEPNGELRKITHGLASSPGENHYRILAEYNYEYRPDGLIDAIQENSATGKFVRSYKYDTVGRLVRATDARGRQHSFEYDLVGNRKKSLSSARSPQVLTYDWAGRVTSLNEAPIKHDAAGNLTTLSIGGTTWEYNYNQDNQLADARNGKVTYRYDGEGQLIARKIHHSETNFIPDPLSDYWRPLAMEDKAGHRTLVIWDGPTPLMMIRNGTPEYLLHDHLGSVRLVMDGQGKITQHLDYDPFGTMLEDTTAAEDFAPRFAGLFWDPDAGVYLTRARAYSPSLGRFLQVDPKLRVPFGSQKDMSVYVYCGSDPVNFVDRDGVAPQFFSAVQQFPRSPLPNATNSDIQQFRMNAAAYYRDRAIKQTNPLLKIRDKVLFGWQATQAGLYDARSRLDSNYNLIRQQVITNAAESNRFKAGIWTAIDAIAYAAGEFSFGGVTSGLAKMSDPTQTYAERAWGAVTGTIFLWGPYFDKFAAKLATKSMYAASKTLISDGVVIKHNIHGKLLLPLQKAAQTSYGQRQITKGFELKKFADISKKVVGESRNLFDYTAQLFGNLRQIDTKKYGSSMLIPANVGGVYLGGAGQSLESIGLIKGVSLDTNNNLVLLGITGGQIELPPLRIDDVVTVFRSVYLNGEGPTVTIDPNPENPEGSVMVVKHSKATKDTYVGWILFQADRLMKGYTLGKDNETEQQVSSLVPEYYKVLDTIYFGGKSANKFRKKGHWERFWIVPAEARRFSKDKTKLTLFDVPLKVKTQTMKWENGDLVDDLKGKSSPGAIAFTGWFTDKYDQIAKEQYLTPPPESRITEPVPVFTELRRIALITAIAEKLRDQGVSLPFWMRDYEIVPVPFEEFTSGIQVTRFKQGVTSRVYGGVQLSAEDKNIRDFTSKSNLSNLPKKEQRLIRNNIELAGTLGKTIRTEMTGIEPLKISQFKHNGADFQAVALPGSATQALAPARLHSVDLSITLNPGYTIQLARKYNSFFDPNGLWGKGWTLDLPRLIQTKVPVGREDSNVTYRTAYDLITPLNSNYARFSRIENVPALNNSRLLVSDDPSDFLGMADGQPDYLQKPTLKLIRKDDGAWHFNKAGNLMAIENSGFRTIYERSKNEVLERIVGMVGKQPILFIELEYNKSGKLKSARARRANRDSAENSVSFTYNDIGKLTSVVSASGKLNYGYQQSRLTNITHHPREFNGNLSDEMATRHFEYNSRGQLLGEVIPDGTKITYKIASNPSGNTLTTQSDTTSDADFIRYDPSFRPVQANFADDSQIQWDYPAVGGLIMDIKQSDGNTVRLTESPDRHRRTLEFDNKHQIVGEFDTAGRLTSVFENGHTLMKQKWSPLGKLQITENETLAKHFEYATDGRLSRIIQAPPGENSPFQHWQTTKVDPVGRPVEITDYRGMHLSIGYDHDGKLEQVVTSRVDDQKVTKRYGFKLIRDRSDRVREIRSSWGNQEYSYDSGGLVKELKTTKGGKKALVYWNSGLLSKVEQFDGGTVSIAYYANEKHANTLEKITTPNELALTYQYDTSNRLKQVDIGKTSNLNFDYDDNGNLTLWEYQAVR